MAKVPVQPRKKVTAKNDSSEEKDTDILERAFLMTDELTLNDVVDPGKANNRFEIEIEQKELIDCLWHNTFNIDLNISDQMSANKPTDLFPKTRKG